MLDMLDVKTTESPRAVAVVMTESRRLWMESGTLKVFVSDDGRDPEFPYRFSIQTPSSLQVCFGGPFATLVGARTAANAIIADMDQYFSQK